MNMLNFSVELWYKTALGICLGSDLGFISSVRTPCVELNNDGCNSRFLSGTFMTMSQALHLSARGKKISQAFQH